MEHLIQISIAMDDETIAKQAIEIASKNVAKEITEQIFQVNYYDRIEGFSGHAKGVIAEVMESYKDKIIAEASRMVADSIKKSKKYKDLVKDLPDSVEGSGET